MFEKRLFLFKLLGFKVQADASWLFLALLVTWSLARGYFPSYYEGLSLNTYWWMGIAGMIGLFLCLILHELSHSLVARQFGLPIKGITLFIFGGVAEMEEEPPSAKVEFLVAIAGPIASFALAALFHILASFAERKGFPAAVWGVAGYLALINVVLAVFNLVPAFPLDGGRVFRAVLWRWKGDLRWATRWASRSGQVFGYTLIFLGVLNVLNANFIAGMWWFLIGMFLNVAARSAYVQLLTRRAFEGEPIARFMTPDPVTVSPAYSVRTLVEDYIYRHHFDLFPVVDEGRVIGLVGARHVKSVPLADWERARVADILEPYSMENTVDPRTDSVKALSTMRQTGQSRLMVVDDGRLVGVVALKDMLELFALKMDLEQLD